MSKEDSWVREALGADPANYTVEHHSIGDGILPRPAAEPEIAGHVSMQLPKEQKPIVMEPLHLGEGANSPEMREAARGQRAQAERDLAEKRRESAALVENAITRCIALQANYGVMVKGACDLFASAAKKKVAETEQKDVSAWVLLGPVLEVAAAALSAYYAPVLIASKLGAQVMQKTAAAVSKSMVGAAAAAIKQQGTVEKGIEALVAHATLVSAAMRGAAEAGVKEPLVRLVGKLKSKDKAEELTNPERNLIEDLYAQPTDVVLESLGLPQAMTAKKFQMKMFGSLFKEFEKQRIIAYEQEHDLSTDIGLVETAAEHNAREAVKELQAAEDEVAPRP